MPNLKRITLPRHDTVNRALHGGIVDLLPPSFAENELVQWVVEVDATLKARTYEDDYYEARRGRDSQMGVLLGRMGSSLLQSRIPFYFASIFHIGRMIVVSAESLERINVL